MEKYIGNKLKEKRKHNNYTIAVLSSKTGLSESLISRVEKGNVVPSINTLRKIAQGLDVSITEFFKEEIDLKEEKIVVRKEERKKLVVPGSNTIYEILTPNLNQKIELLKVELGPYCEEENLIQLGHEEEECAFVIEGEVEFNFDNEYVRLTEGDCVCLNRDLLKKVKNVTSENAHIILAVAH